MLDFVEGVEKRGGEAGFGGLLALLESLSLSGPPGRLRRCDEAHHSTENRAIKRVERVSYARGFVESLVEEAQRLPAITIEAVDLPEDVLTLLDHHHLDLGGTYVFTRQATRSSTANYVTGGPAALGWAVVSRHHRLAHRSATAPLSRYGVGGAGENRIA